VRKTKGSPAPYVAIVLMQDGEIVANTLTDEDGNYSFTGLTPGTYDVFVEVPEYEQEITAEVVLDEQNPDQEDVNFTIWITDDRIITDVDVTDGSFNLKMYPNPTSGRVNIDLTWNDIRKVEVTIFNILGTKAFSREYQAGDLISFDMSKYVSGMYLVKIDTEGRSVIKKLILDRQ
jgi:hypothetical protein